MRKITIFLAAGELSLEKERSEITALIKSLNTRYSSKGIRLKLFKTGSEVQYTAENFNNSEMVFLVAYNELSKEDLDCFNKAIEKFQVQDSPKIVTYFKMSENPSKELLDFMNHLDKDIGHYYSLYDNIDNLKYRILLNLLSLESNLKIEYKNSKIMLEDEEVGTISDLPCMKNNKTLQSLKEKLEQTEDEYYKAMAKSAKEKTKENRNAVAKLYFELDNLQEEFEKLEENIFSAMINLANNTAKSGLSKMQILAYKYLEEGNYDEANAVLDFKKIKKSIDHTQELLEKAKLAKLELEKLQRQNVDTILQKIQTLQLMLNFPNRFDEIENLYNEAMTAEKNAEIEAIATYEYAQYLYNQNEYDKAIEIFSQLLKNNNEENEKKSDILDYLGLNCSANKSYYEAENAFVKSLEIREKLCENGEGFKTKFALGKLHISNLYSTMNEHEKAKNAMAVALKIYEDFCESNPNFDKSELVNIYNQFSKLLKEVNNYSDAKKIAKKAIEIYENLTEEQANSCQVYLADAYNNLAGIYNITQKVLKSSETYLKAIEIYENLYEKNPRAFELNLANAYYNMANHYINWKGYNLAYDILIKAMPIYDELSEKNPKAYLPILADGYNKMGDLYNGEDGEKLYLIALQIREKLYAENKEVYAKDLMEVYKNLSTFYKNDKNYEKAKDYGFKSLNIIKSLSEKNKEIYSVNLAENYYNLADLYLNLKSFDKAKGFFHESLEIYEELKIENPIVFTENTMYNYAKLSVVYLELKEFETSKKMAEKAIDLDNNYHGKRLFLSDPKVLAKEILEKDTAIIKIIELKEKREKAISSELVDIYCELYEQYKIVSDKENSLDVIIKAVEICKKLYEENKIEHELLTIKSFSLLGNYHCEMDENEKAEMNYLKIFEFCKNANQQNEKPAKFSKANNSYNLAILYKKMQKKDDCEKMFLASTEQMKILFSENYTDKIAKENLNKYYDALFSFYIENEDLEKAEDLCLDYLQFCLDINEDEERLNPRKTFVKYKDIADIYEKKNDFSTAVEMHLQLIKIYELFGIDEFISSDYFTIAHIYLQNSEYKKAKEYLLICLELYQKNNKTRDFEETLALLENVNKLLYWD